MDYLSKLSLQEISDIFPGDSVNHSLRGGSERINIRSTACDIYASAISSGIYDLMGDEGKGELRQEFHESLSDLERNINLADAQGNEEGVNNAIRETYIFF